MDLIGARTIKGYDCSCFRSAAPRWRKNDLLYKFNIGNVKAASDEEVAAAGQESLLNAVSIAFGTDLGLGGRPQEMVAARATFVRLGRIAGYPTTQLASAMGMKTRGACRLASVDINTQNDRIARTQLSLQRVAAEKGRGDFARQ
ncbi:MAG: hypothetical protein HN348_26280 [Proteobacteria bacterium]|nr:hypothetical protein [Pseudomonadota bacterium]